MTKKQQNKLVPKLRFPEFKDSGEWAKESISSILDYERPDAYIVSTTDYNTTGIPVLTANKSFILGYTTEKDGIYFNLPAIIFDDFTVDKKFVDFPFKVKSSAIKILKEKGDNNLRFIYESLSQIKFSPTEHKRYYISEYQNITIGKPHIKEQQKIADCLSSLDDLITTENEKLKALQEHKKGLMQQLFPATGEKVPKLRFKEFRNSGEWVEKTLEELGDNITGLTYSPDDVRDNGLLVLRSSNIQNGKILLDDCVYVRADIKGAHLTKPGDILICVRNGSKALIGKNALIPIEMPLSTHGAFMTIFRAFKPEFVFQLFQTESYFNQVSNDLGATINSINGKNFLKYTFYVPNPDEQQKIADTLSLIDEQINKQADKIETLKLHKKGLMQQLFPEINNNYGQS